MKSSTAGGLSAGELRAIARFADQAQTLCEVLEVAPTTARGDLLGQLLIRLAELAKAAPLLPAPGGSPTRAPAHDRTWRALAEQLRAALGPDDLYWRPGDGDGEVAAASVGDDLADIDREMRRGLRLADGGDLAGAAHVWRDGFERRWGGHVHRLTDRVADG